MSIAPDNLFFRIAPTAYTVEPGPLRCEARILDHMLKDAVVADPACAHAWRVASDEGAQVRGTDLAPAPLMLFNAAQQFSLLARVAALARERGVALPALASSVVNTYAIRGSFFRGDAKSSVSPARIEVRAGTAPDPEAVAEVVRDAIAGCHAEQALRTPLSNTFSFYVAGRRLVAGPGPALEDPAARIARAVDAGAAAPPVGLLERLPPAMPAEPPAPGATPAGLAPEQNRGIRVEGTCTREADGRLVCEVGFGTVNGVPARGSRFRLAADPAGERAPSPPAQVAAAIAFCFMTQFHRYAEILKQPLGGLRLVQANPCSSDGSVLRVGPIDTHVFVEADLPEEAALRMLRVSQQTCFLHAALAGSHPSTVRVAFDDGRAIDL